MIFLSYLYYLIKKSYPELCFSEQFISPAYESHINLTKEKKLYGMVTDSRYGGVELYGKYLRNVREERYLISIKYFQN